MKLIFLEAHCQKQWSSVEVKFSGGKSGGGDRSLKYQLEPMWDLKSHKGSYRDAVCGKLCINSLQSLVILGSFLRWRWQWASIGHFVFLFSSTGCFRSTSFHSRIQSVQSNPHFSATSICEFFATIWAGYWYLLELMMIIWHTLWC